MTEYPHMGPLPGNRYRVECLPNGLYLLWSYGAAMIIGRTEDRNTALEWSQQYNAPMVAA